MNERPCGGAATPQSRFIGKLGLSAPHRRHLKGMSTEESFVCVKGIPHTCPKQGYITGLNRQNVRLRAASGDLRGGIQITTPLFPSFLLLILLLTFLALEH